MRTRRCQHIHAHAQVPLDTHFMRTSAHAGAGIHTCTRIYTCISRTHARTHKKMNVLVLVTCTHHGTYCRLECIRVWRHYAFVLQTHTHAHTMERIVDSNASVPGGMAVLDAPSSHSVRTSLLNCSTDTCTVWVHMCCHHRTYSRESDVAELQHRHPRRMAAHVFPPQVIQQRE